MMWGVGMIGSGPGVAALHEPTLARMDGDFRLVHVSDAGSGRAVVIADRFGALTEPCPTCGGLQSSDNANKLSPRAMSHLWWVAGS